MRPVPHHIFEGGNCVVGSLLPESAAQSQVPDQQHLASLSLRLRQKRGASGAQRRPREETPSEAILHQKLFSILTMERGLRTALRRVGPVDPVYSSALYNENHTAADVLAAQYGVLFFLKTGWGALRHHAHKSHRRRMPTTFRRYFARERSVRSHERGHVFPSSLKTFTPSTSWSPATHAIAQAGGHHLLDAISMRGLQWDMFRRSKTVFVTELIRRIA